MVKERISESGRHMVDERIKGMMYNIERICRTRKKVVNGRCYQKINKIRWLKRIRRWRTKEFKQKSKRKRRRDSRWWGKDNEGPKMG
jgi:hypothetical protein